MNRRSMIPATLLAVAAMGVLAGCSGEAAAPATSAPVPAPTASSAAPTAAADPTPVASPDVPTAPVSLPTSCDALGTSTTRQQTIGGFTEQPGSGFERVAPQGATLELGCNWIQDEVAGVVLLISTASDAAVTTAVSGLAADGYSCQGADDFGAEYCVKPGGALDTQDVVVARGGVWIYLETVNVNADAWLSEISSQVFN